MTVWLEFLGGLFIGVCVAVFIIGLCVAARDERSDHGIYESINRKEGKAGAKAPDTVCGVPAKSDPDASGPAGQ